MGAARFFEPLLNEKEDTPIFCLGFFFFRTMRPYCLFFEPITNRDISSTSGAVSVG